MSDLTHPERIDAAVNLAFARWLANLGGWCFDTQYALTDDERQIANQWVVAGLLRHSEMDRQDVLELTAAGRAWCDQYGIA